MALNMANAGVQAEANGLNTEVANGYLRIYDGTKPATGDTALGSQNKLAEFVLPATVFSNSNGVMTANAITPVTGLYDSTATWYRVWKSDGTTPEWQGDVGAEMTLNSTHITVGAAVSVTSWTHTVTK
jgi:hypothetical protein